MYIITMRETIRSKMKTFGIAAILVALLTTPLLAQTKAGQLDPVFVGVQDGSIRAREKFTKAADQMSEEDYAFKPTPEVRSFGQLLAHVAEANYEFCSLAKGEKQPVRDIEKTKTTRADIRKVLSESFAYCDGAFAGLTDAKAKEIIEYMGKQRPILVLLMFRNQHNAAHYGNVVTYMRLRGKVPPTTAREIQ